nr:retrovirus-related Pol polyprotein from transposon TNT 1-94 [Tanacetum cinerariifolium]
MLEKGNCIPWESRFRRFFDNNHEEGDQMWRSIKKGPYVRPMIPNPDKPTEQILEPLSKMTEGNKKHYIADVGVKNYLLQAIPNDIYNLVDVSKEGESLESVYERLTTLVNIMDRNNVRPIPVLINTKFLNCLQPKWSKYVTMVRPNQTGDVVSYDQLYDSLVQFKPHVQASKAKKAAKNHDPLALLAHSNASSSQSHANSSYSRQPYYVTYPSSVTDYKDEYQGVLQGDSQEDKLTTAMIVDIQTKNAGYGGNGNKNAGRRNMNQAFNAGTRNDESNQIIQRVPRIESNLGKTNVQYYNCNKKGHYARDCQKPKVHDAKYFKEQMLLAIKDEAGSNLKDKENDFMLDNSYGDETLEELTVAAVSKVNASTRVHEKVNRMQRKTIIHTSNDDQINSNIIFDNPYVENNGGTSEHDSTAHDEYHDIKMLAYNVQREAENKKRLNNERKKQKKMKPKADIGYYATSPPEVSDNFAAHTLLDNENTSSSSLIVVKEDEAPQINLLEMFFIIHLKLLYSKKLSHLQHVRIHQICTSFPKYIAIPDKWTKNHLIEEVTGDPSKPVMTRRQLHTDDEVCMCALIVSTIEPKNITEAMLDASWIESMQDELNQFKRLDVWELVECPIDRNIIAVKWIWKNKTDAENTVIQNKSCLVSKGYGQEEQYTKKIKEQEDLIDSLSDQLIKLKNTVKVKQTKISELEECLRKKNSENEPLKPKVVDCTICQNLQVQVEELKSVNENFNLSIEELYKAHVLAEVTLRERDEKISVLQKKLRLLEEQSKVFHEVQSECDSEIFHDTKDNS